MKVQAVWLFGLMLLLPGPAQADEAFLATQLTDNERPASGAGSDEKAVDPLEKMNRFIFRLNDTMDTYFLVPVTKVWRSVVPAPARIGTRNFTTNFVQINTAFYQILQAKPARASTSLARFLINTTLGFGGLFDPATDMGLPRYSEDLGQTLGVWGIGPGPYVVMPFLGPSTLRDAMARIPAFFTEAQNSLNTEDRLNLFVVDILAFREALLGAEQVFSGDRYIAFRDAYLSRREWQVRDGRIPEADEEVDDLLEELFDEEEFLDEESNLQPPVPHQSEIARTRMQPFPFPIELYSPKRKRLALLRMMKDFHDDMPAGPPEPADGTERENASEDREYRDSPMKNLQLQPEGLEA